MPVVNALKVGSYLELGVYDNANFHRINAETKVGVDTNGKGTFTGTTDEFFAQNRQHFDAIFIDADHSCRQVTKDWNNSVFVADRFILLHDMIPPSLKHTAPGYCGDSFRLLNWFLLNNVPFRALDGDCGLTMVLRKDFRLARNIPDVTYEEFLDNLCNTELVTVAQMVAYGK